MTNKNYKVELRSSKYPNEMVSGNTHYYDELSGALEFTSKIIKAGMIKNEVVLLINNKNNKILFKHKALISDSWL